MSVVLDASAVLAWFQSEPGSDVVSAMLPDSSVSAANWSEIMQKVRQHGGDQQEVALLLDAAGIDVVAVSREDAELGAQLWTPRSPLSLADRLCLALASRLQLPAVTAERLWQQVVPKLGLEIEIRVIR